VLEKAKTKKQLVAELNALRLRVAQLEKQRSNLGPPEDALRENEEKYRKLFQNDLVAICIHDLQTLCFLDVNNALVKLYGYSSEELLDGMTVTDLSAEPEASIESIRQTESVGPVHVPLRYHRRKDGTVFPVEIFGDTCIIKGRRVMSCMILDISDRVQAEKAKEETGSMLKNTMNAIQDLVTVHDRDLRVVLSNWRGLDHIPPEERDSFPHCYTCFMRRDAQCQSCPTEEVFRTGLSVRREVLNTLNNRLFEVNAYPVVDASGNFDLVTEHVRDITELKKAELEREQLRAKFHEVQKMESVGRLAGGVAHDFNNMLGVIIGRAEMAIQEVDATQPIHSDLEEILVAANRSANLVRQLLAFARSQTINPEILDINASIENMLEMLHKLMGGEIELQWNPGSDLWAVKMDPAQTEQILIKLCVNARDAIAGCGKVSIATENVSTDRPFSDQSGGASRNEYVLLTVSDNGCGMHEEVMGKLFEPFFTTKEVGKGTGLGLATVYGIVRQNDGYIDVESKPGQGTRFFIYLPRAALSQPAAPLSKRSHRDVDGAGTILFVDDESAVLGLGRKILEKFGYHVLVANGPAQALDMAASYPDPIDLLITDVIMPGINGKELAKELGTLKPAVRSIYISGYTREAIDKLHEMNGVDFLQKPFSVNDLIGKVREVLVG
jgi:two-component system cell cycle sensor histidine kinase/response regulator CckA